MKLIKYKNLRRINKEVNIIEIHNFYEGFDSEILLQKKKGNYYLTKRYKNNYIIFDLKN